MRQTTILSILFLTYLTACQGQNNIITPTTANDNSSTADTSFIPTDSTQFYFPPKLFGDTSKWLDNFVNTWYSQQLFAMREPILFIDKSQNEIYRFTWLRTFDNPIAIRIEKHGDTYLLFWKLCNGAGGYHPGQLTVNKQKIIDKQTWDTFKNKLNEINFGNLPTTEKEIMGTDGSRWILEGKSVKQYHVVDRWTPSEKSKYYQCCNFLIGLTDLNIKGGDKY